MPTFEFDVASSTSDTGSSISVFLPFTDPVGSTAFTLSGGATNPGFNLVGANDGGAGDGFLSIAGSGTGATFTLDVSAIDSFFAQSGGNITVNAGPGGSGAFNVTFVGRTGTPNVVQTIAPGGSASFATSGVFTGIRFTQTNAGASNLVIDSLTASIVCYLEGTGIGTPEGRVQVEDLRAGDVVMTADGRTTAVQWVGTQTVNSQLSDPAKVNPIRIAKGAISDNVPSRDLLVSPDHAVEIDGYLVNASALVNGRTITSERNMPLSGFTYYHIETTAHELLLAEGCPAESYVDFVGRDRFDNGAERASAPVIQEMALPRISAARMVPSQIKAKLQKRADAQGDAYRFHAA